MTTTQEIANAIGESISRSTIAHLDWSEEREDELTAIASDEGGDSVANGDVFEAWGAAGNGWRVHLDGRPTR